MGLYLTPMGWIVSHFCCILDITALGIVVSEKKFFFHVFSYHKPIADQRGMVGRIYKGNYYPRLYTKYKIKIIVRSFGSSKNTKLEDGPYCTISGNEPSSVTLYKTGSESQTFCCNF